MGLSGGCIQALHPQWGQGCGKKSWAGLKQWVYGALHGESGKADPPMAARTPPGPSQLWGGRRGGKQGTFAGSGSHHCRQLEGTDVIPPPPSSSLQLFSSGVPMQTHRAPQRPGVGAPGAFLTSKRMGGSWQPPATLPHGRGAGAGSASRQRSASAARDPGVKSPGW